MHKWKSSRWHIWFLRKNSETIFMRKKIFLVKNIQAETQLCHDIQLIPTNPNPMSELFSEISGNSHPIFVISHGSGSLGYTKLFSDLAAWIPLQGKLLKKPQLLHPWGCLSLCFKPRKLEL